MVKGKLYALNVSSEVNYLLLIINIRVHVHVAMNRCEILPPPHPPFSSLLSLVLSTLPTLSPHPHPLSPPSLSTSPPSPPHSSPFSSFLSLILSTLPTLPPHPHLPTSSPFSSLLSLILSMGPSQDERT